MSDSTLLDQIAALPGVRGSVLCDSQGKAIARDGEEIDRLADSLGDLFRLGSEVGAAFGLEALDQVELYDHNLTAACVTHREGVVGVMLASRVGVLDVVNGMQAVLGRA